MHRQRTSPMGMMMVPFTTQMAVFVRMDNLMRMRVAVVSMRNDMDMGVAMP